MRSDAGDLEGADLPGRPGGIRVWTFHRRILSLAQLGFVERREVIYFLGPPGTGKSHLALALGLEAVKVGKSVYFCTLGELVRPSRPHGGSRCNEQPRHWNLHSAVLLKGLARPGQMVTRT